MSQTGSVRLSPNDGRFVRLWEHRDALGQASIVRKLLKCRLARQRHFRDGLFADPAWDMLLELYATKLAGRLISVTSIIGAASVPYSTGLRWLNTLIREGLAVRRADPMDGRRVFVEISAKGFDAMDNYFRGLPPDLFPL